MPAPSLSLFRALIDRSSDAIEVVDPDTLRFLDSNQKAFLELGYTRQEFLSMTVYDIDPTLNPETLATARERLNKSGEFVKEGIHRRKDGSTFPVEINLSFVQLDESYVIVVARDITARKVTEDLLRQLSVQLLHAQDEECRRIAREMHDGIGQYAVGLTLALGQLRQCLDETNLDSERLFSDCRRLVKRVSREIRTMSCLLHPPLIDELGLEFALRWLAKSYAERSGIAVSLEAPLEFGRLKSEAEMTLFRVAQESLSNVLRHSGSPAATVRLMRTSDEVMLEIADRGKGMPSRSAASTDGFGVGLLGIQARVKNINGRFDLDSSPNKGVTIRVGLPLT
jgi:PAS domain S-box-containing protein